MQDKQERLNEGKRDVGQRRPWRTASSRQGDGTDVGLNFLAVPKQTHFISPPPSSM